MTNEAAALGDPVSAELAPTLPRAGRAELTRDGRAYKPYGVARDLMYSRHGEIIISGPAGTGKSRACLEKLHIAARNYPGMRGLILRKRRKDLTESGLVTWEEKVLPARHESLGRVHRETRHVYRYGNGSQIVVGGLDDPDKVMSAEYDLAFVQEGREIDEGDWEAVTTRLRNAVMPYQQVIGDTNPDAPHHWIRQRSRPATGGAAELQKLLLLESRHEDNPQMYDRARRVWTPRGLEYLRRLETLTGVRRDRLLRGAWTAAEGLVYDGWNPRVHLIRPFAIPRDWQRLWSIDFGFTNPFVCQAYAMDGDGRLYLYRELYYAGRLVEDHARRMLEALGVPVVGGVAAWSDRACREPRPRTIVCDHDAEGRATLVKYLGVANVAAFKDKEAGLQDVAARLRVAGDGKPRLFIFDDALIERDAKLVDAKKPTCTAEEFDSYVWSNAARKGDEPVKVDDHGMDALRYVVHWLDRVGGTGGYYRPATPAAARDDGPGGIQW